LYIDPLADSNGGITFGFTAQWQGRVAGSDPEPARGLRGSTRVRVGESVKELCIADKCGYFIQNAVA
jgi:hypothetical protein